MERYFHWFICWECAILICFMFELWKAAMDASSGDSLSEKATFLRVLRVIRMARVVRIAKLSRHSRNLNTLIKTMSTSLRELNFILLFFIVSMVLFATFVYYCEEDYQSTDVRQSRLDTASGLICLFSLLQFQLRFGGPLLQWRQLVMAICSRGRRWEKSWVSSVPSRVFFVSLYRFPRLCPTFTEFTRLKN